MDWRFTDDRPIWLQLTEQLTRRIITGVYPPGSRLPPVRELAAQAGVNPNTMQRALAQLEQDAARQGAKRLELNTFGFQAPGFYEKLGYRRFGAVEPAVGEYGHYFYVKEL